MATSKDVTDFAMAWVFENITAGPYEPGDQIITGHVDQLKADAEARSISEEDLEKNLGDLHDYISEALEEATDSEVERLVAKDD